MVGYPSDSLVEFISKYNSQDRTNAVYYCSDVCDEANFDCDLFRVILYRIHIFIFMCISETVLYFLWTI